MPLPQVSIIGTGNIALLLSKTLEQNGIKVLEIVGRDLKKAQKIASQLYDTVAVSHFDLSSSQAKLFFLCVSDNVISEVGYRLRLPAGTLLVHCSGATPLQSIERDDVDFGVFYPVQTFSSSRKISLKEVPICLEASTDVSEGVLEEVAKKIGGTPCFMNSEQRLVLHLSAVFACNFSNYFFSIAQQLLEDQGLPFELLHPLISETVKKAMELGPENSQTGPAIRKDYKTMDLHKDVLINHPNWKELYVSISEKIIKSRS